MTTAVQSSYSQMTHGLLRSSYDQSKGRCESVIARLATDQDLAKYMVTKCPAFADLIVGNPALCCVLIDWIGRGKIKHPIGNGSFATLIEGRQRLLCGAIGLPPTESSARILRKLVPESCTPPALSDLMELLQSSKALKILTHLPSLNPSVLRILNSSELNSLVSNSFLYECCSEPPKLGSVAITELKEYAAIMEKYWLRGSWLIPFVSRRDLTSRLICLRSRVCIRFPNSPLNLPANFSQITTVDELFVEGELQQNCVQHYARATKQKNCLIYRMREPERATILIKLIKGRWVATEISCSKNRRAHCRTEDYVHQVIDAVQDGDEPPTRLPSLEDISGRNFKNVQFPSAPQGAPPAFEPIQSSENLACQRHIPEKRIPSLIHSILEGAIFAFHISVPIDAIVTVERQFSDDLLDSVAQWEVCEIFSLGSEVSWESYDEIARAFRSPSNQTG